MTSDNPTFELQILHEDDDILAVFKPAWLLVHRGMGRDEVTLVDLVRDYLGPGKVHPMHRLDRQTSGVVLFAKSPEVTRFLRTEFDEGRVDKTYLAMVRGIAPDDGFIDHPVPKSEDGERIDAQTKFRTLASIEVEPRAVSVVECKPITGRFHQLRRHMCHINHPILLDSNYGPTKLNRKFKEQWGMPRLTLHCSSLTFARPDGATMTVDSELPEDLAEVWTRMGIWPVE